MICIFFLAYSILTFTEIPGLVIGLIHYRVPDQTIASASYYAYWTRRYALWITSALVRGGVELVLAGIFYRIGPRVERFLLGDGSEGEPIEGEGSI